MLGSIGFTELLVILLIVVFIFGTSRIPELGKGLGEGIKNFKKAIKGNEEEEKKKP
jgi:sec-independent protein translocase protein TatA